MFALHASYRKFPLAVFFTYGNMYVSTWRSQLSHPFLSPLCPQVYSLHLHRCPANRVISTVSLDSTCTCAKLHQSRVTLCSTVDCSPPGSSVHGILQARILEWVAMPSQGIFLTQGLNLCLLQLLHWWADSLPLSHQGSPTAPLWWHAKEHRKKILFSVDGAANSGFETEMSEQLLFYWVPVMYQEILCCFLNIIF